MSKFTKEEIELFLNGSDPMERIVKIECGYDDNQVTIFYRDENGNKQVMKDDFHPFCWCKQEAARRLYNGNRQLIKAKMAEYGIACKLLQTQKEDGTEPDRMKNGYKLLFHAVRRTTYSNFMEFFQKGGVPIYPKVTDGEYGKENFIISPPVEQYMISSGKRQFKGFNDYNDVVRFIFDLETEGLDPEIHSISQIGIRTNKGYEKIIKIKGEGEDKIQSEIDGIREFFQILADLDPDVLTGHNIENFDLNFFIVRVKKLLGLDIAEFTKEFFNVGIYKKKKKSVLKLGGEMEYFNATVKSGTHITDSLFAVRRSQAQDSNMKRADLKYVTIYSKLNKENRVYVPGNLINDIWEDEEKHYAFNDEDGDWYLYDPSHEKGVTEFKKGLTDGKFHLYTRNYVENGYKLVSGTYIVERYLLDDLYEADKVEHKFNSTNFFLSKILPVSYDKICTMGTAAIWKNIMLAWSYEHDLAIPQLIQTHSFTGGLSRTLTTGILATGLGSDLEQKEFGHKSNEEDKRCVAKLDYNSLYPSIILSFGIQSSVDIQNVLPLLLNYVLTEREYFKDLKKKYNKLYEKEEKELEQLTPNTQEYKEKELDIKKHKSLYLLYDNIQVLWKLCGNSYFGAFGCGQPYPWSDLVAAEKVTCIGRMLFRLLCYHFKNLDKIKPTYR